VYLRTRGALRCATGVSMPHDDGREDSVTSLQLPEHAAGETDSTLRDRLAVDRTELANERTLLAYARTGLALLVVGGSFLKFFDTVATALAGWLFVLLGVFVIAVGTARFVSARHRLSALRRRIERAPASVGHARQATRHPET